MINLFKGKNGSSDKCIVDSSDMKLIQTPIISMEDDEVSDQESVSCISKLITFFIILLK